MSMTEPLADLWSEMDVALARYAVPIYGMRGKRSPILLGTGFLLDVSNKRFLVTAAHLIFANEREHELSVPGVQGFYLLPPMFRSLLKNPSDHDFDIAFDELPPQLVTALGRYPAVPIAWASPNHIPDERYAYTLTGFPTSRNKPGVKGNMVHAIVHRFHARTAEYDDYERRGLNVALHLGVCAVEPNPSVGLGSRDLRGQVWVSRKPRLV
jgi:hypothetical protein